MSGDIPLTMHMVTMRLTLCWDQTTVPNGRNKCWLMRGRLQSLEKSLRALVTTQLGIKADSPRCKQSQGSETTAGIPA